MNIEHQALSLTSTTYVGQSYIPTPATFFLQAKKNCLGMAFMSMIKSSLQTSKIIFLSGIHGTNWNKLNPWRPHPAIYGT